MKTIPRHRFPNSTILALALGLALGPALAPAQPAKSPRVVTVAVVMGLKDKEATVWEGKFTTTGCEVIETDGWRFTGDDYVSKTEYRIKTRPFVARFATRDPKFDITKTPITPNGIVLGLATTGPGASLKIATPKGDIDIALAAFGYGPARKALDGQAEFQRLPNYSPVVRSPKEDSYPAAAMGKDGLVASYVALTHGPNLDSTFKLPGDVGAPLGGKKKGKKVGGPSDAAPDNFDFLTAPCGGDQVMSVAQNGGVWGPPEPVTDPGQRVLGTAVAIDGDGRAWIFWSARDGDNWDIFARARTGGTWAAPVRVSTAKGSDVLPRATTDAKGRAWVTWQSLGESSADILAAAQQGDKFSAPETIASGPANEWEPSIAASADGQVAIAWDTYEQGSYDVMVRLWNNEGWGEPQPVARGPKGEARPSIAFDSRNRLWVAYEVAPENWGKDFGPYDFAPNRTALYQNRSIGLRVLDGTRWLAPESPPAEAFPIAKSRPGAGVMVDAQDRRLVAHPRIAIAGDGRVWLSARAKITRFEANTGDTWVEHLTCLDGEKWRTAFPALGSDAYLHQAAALLPSPTSGVTLLAVSDGRFRAASRMNLPPIYTKRSPGSPPATTRNQPEYPDPIFNQEIYLIETGTVSRPDAEPKLADAGPHSAASPSPELAEEAAQVKAIREYRAEIGGKSLRIARGEFHRHTEFSSDGGGDGSIFDMWRYGMDMAALDWIGNGDHDNGSREFPWWITQKTTSAYHIPGAFFPVWSYERSNNYPDGHRNAIFTREGVRPLPRLRGGLGKIMDELGPDAQRPNSPDSLMFFKYLGSLGGICASHTSGTDMGTDWRDFGGKVEPVVEIYQGDRNSYERPGGPRASNDQFSLGGFRPFGFVSLALKKGYRMGFQASSDHVSTHMSYCSVYVEEPTRQGVAEGMRKRHVYGATDNIIADVRCGEHFMGDEFTTDKPPTIRVRLVGTAPFAEVVIIKDDEIVYASKPEKQAVEFAWTDAKATPGKTSYYYVRGTQQGETTTRKAKSPSGDNVEVPIHNGEVVWVSPMWITLK